MTERGNFQIGTIVTAGTRHVLVPSNIKAGRGFCCMEHLIVTERLPLGMVATGAGGRQGAGRVLHIVTEGGNNGLMAPLANRRHKAGGILGNVTERLPIRVPTTGAGSRYGTSCISKIVSQGFSYAVRTTRAG